VTSPKEEIMNKEELVSKRNMHERKSPEVERRSAVVIAKLV